MFANETVVGNACVTDGEALHKLLRSAVHSACVRGAENRGSHVTLHMSPPDTQRSVSPTSVDLSATDAGSSNADPLFITSRIPHRHITFSQSAIQDNVSVGWWLRGKTPIFSRLLCPI